MRSAVTLLLAGLLVVSLPMISIFSVHATSSPIIFQTAWGGSDYDYGAGVTVDSSGNNYLTGYTYSFGANSPNYASIFLIKFDSSGNLQWQRIWGGNRDDEATSIAHDASGNSYITGYTDSFGKGNACSGTPCSDLVILKFDSSGSLAWQRTWGSNSTEIGNNIAVDASGNIVIAGRFSNPSYESGVIVKLDATGSMIWQKAVNATTNAIATDSSGNVYVAGSSFYTSTTRGDVILLKFNSSGNLQWGKTWGGSTFDEARSLALDSQDNIYMTGDTSSFGAPGSNAIILKFDSSGGLLWQRTWGLGNDRGNGIVVDSSGNVDVTGTSSSFSGYINPDVFLLQLDNSGNRHFQAIWGGPSRDNGQAIAVDSSGNALVAGYETGTLPYNMSATPGAFFGSPSFLAQTPALNVTTLAYTIATPTGSVSTPAGSTTYSGGNDAFLFKYSFTAPGQTPGTQTGTQTPAPEFTLALLLVITGIGAATSIAVMSVGYLILKRRWKS